MFRLRERTSLAKTPNHHGQKGSWLTMSKSNIRIGNMIYNNMTLWQQENGTAFYVQLRRIIVPTFGHRTAVLRLEEEEEKNVENVFVFLVKCWKTPLDAEVEDDRRLKRDTTSFCEPPRTKMQNKTPPFGSLPINIA